MLNLTHLRSFLAVVDTGSFLEAGRALGFSQPAVTQHVRKLEDTVNARLIVRRHERCVPSDAGAALAPRARRLLDMAARTESMFDRAPLRIAASGNIGTYLLPPYIRRFRDDHDIAIDVTVTPNPSIAEGLSDGLFDLALMEWWDDRPGFRAVPWRREPLVAITRPDHPWSDNDAITVDALLAEPMIGGEAGTGTGRILAALAEKRGDIQTPALQFGSTEAVKRAVREGLGVSVVFASAVVDEVAAGTLRARPVTGAILAKDLLMILPDSIRPDTAAARFAKHLQRAAA